jgi:hypothetical protein
MTEAEQLIFNIRRDREALPRKQQIQLLRCEVCPMKMLDDNFNCHYFHNFCLNIDDCHIRYLK